MKYGSCSTHHYRCKSRSCHTKCSLFYLFQNIPGQWDKAFVWRRYFYITIIVDTQIMVNEIHQPGERYIRAWHRRYTRGVKKIGLQAWKRYFSLMEEIHQSGEAWRRRYTSLMKEINKSSEWDTPAWWGRYISLSKEIHYTKEEDQQA